METIWQLKAYNEIAAYELSHKAGISMVLARLLLQRGITDADAVNHFLKDNLNDLTSPLLLTGMHKAVQRIISAVENGEKITVYGDYDVDGIASIVIMLECLDFLGAYCGYYIPNRFEEGYGMNKEALQQLKQEGTGLVITVDCGITAYDEALYCQTAGMDLIITDHHIPGEKLPPAYAIINPKLDTNEAFYDLAGAGVAFKLACALTQGKITEKTYQEWLALAALATVADIVPLQKENRIIVKYGLTCIQNTMRLGLRLLLEQAGLNGEKIQAGHLAFKVAPKLNSAGRLHSAHISVEALYAKDPEQIKSCLYQLQTLNDERKRIENDIFQAAVSKIEAAPQLLERPVLIIDGENWNRGVIGIVASRLVGKYHRVTIVISWEDNLGKASCRSVEPVDLHTVLKNCSEYLIAFGGHKKAAGLSLTRDRFTDFYQAANNYVEQNLEWPREKVIAVDAELYSEKHNAQTILTELKQLEPFGEGNPEPLFLLRSVEAGSVSRVGSGGEHLRFKLQPDGIPAIAFQFNPDMALLGGNKVDLIFEVTENKRFDLQPIQYRIIDMKYSMEKSHPAAAKSWTSMTRPAPLYQAFKTLLAHLLKPEPVAIIFPDWRSLQKATPLIQLYFRSDRITFLHGHLPSRELSRGEYSLKQGRPALYLITQPYLYNYLRVHGLPDSLKNILAWGMEKVKLLENSSFDVTGISFPQPVLIWEKTEALSQQPLVYVNQPLTLNRWVKERKLFSEVGERNLHFRRELRILAGRSQGLFTDGVYPEEGFSYNFNQIFLADMPFTPTEITALLVGQNQELPPCAAGFSPEAALMNRSILNQKYPEAETVKRVYSFLLDNSYQLTAQPVINLIQKMNEQAVKITEVEFLSVLNILDNLGLCEYKKNGSIIAIKVSRYNGQALNLKDSVYYLEGLAAKKGLQDCAESIKIR